MKDAVNENTEEILARLMEQYDLSPGPLGEKDGYEWYDILNSAIYRLPENEFMLLLNLADDHTNRFWECYPDILWDIHSRYSLDTVIAAANLSKVSGYLVPVEGEAFPIMAAGWNEPELIRRLVEEVKVSVDAYCESDIFESTGSMLSMAAREGCVDICKYLLDKGADPKGEMLEGITCPLAEAVVGNHVEIARLLLQRGASLQNISYCYEPFSPMDYARENGHLDMVELLQSYTEQ